MKINLIEREYGYEIDIEAETVAEAALLLRLPKQSKAKAPTIVTRFYDKNISMNIVLQRVGPMRREGFILKEGGK